jgi:hypothetical protein
MRGRRKLDRHVERTPIGGQILAPIDTRGTKTTRPLRTTSATNAIPPSMTSLCDGRSRAAEASPIDSGATATMPSASDANQCCQVVRTGAVEPWKYLKPEPKKRSMSPREHSFPRIA